MKDLLKKLSHGELLSETEAKQAVESLFTSTEITDAQIGAFLFSTGSREISVDELVGAAKALRAQMVKIKAPTTNILDTCGTGGSGFNTFNTSTLSAIILAASGVAVAKHGNRASTSQCGSADLLEALEINLNLSPTKIEELLAKTNFCFMFAPQHHPATKRVQIIRRELGFRTIFNFLGPLANPADANMQVLGVSNLKMAKTMASALQRLGTLKALVVHGDDGLDEITTTSKTHIFEVTQKEIKEYTISPEDFGIKRSTLEEIKGFEAKQSAKISREILSGAKNALRDIIVLNSAASFYVYGNSPSIKEGIEIAAAAIDPGSALKKLDQIIKLSNEQ